MSISILSYFFTLSVFSWMTVEGVHILIMLVFVFQDAYTNNKIYTAVAYGKTIDNWILDIHCDINCKKFRGLSNLFNYLEI